jgi:F-type H+-transporting ATPase subunit gamma
MPLLELRQRYKTVESLYGIFSALLVVDVVQTKKLKERFEAMERYLLALRRVLKGRLEDRPLTKKILVVMASNRGLCGNFNEVMAQKARDFIGQNPGTSLAVLGKIGGSLLRRSSIPVALFDQDTVEKPTYKKAAATFKRIFEPDAEIRVVYNSYRSAILQEPTIKRLYPVPEEMEARQNPDDYLFEPAEQTLVPALFYHYLEARFFQMVMDSQMAELAARFMVLKGAVDTSRDMTSELRLALNKARQAGITRELLEIVSAAEALRAERVEDE